MRGSPSEPGVIPLAVRDLFQIIQEVLIYFKKKKGLEGAVVFIFVGKSCVGIAVTMEI